MRWRNFILNVPWEMQLYVYRARSIVSAPTIAQSQNQAKVNDAAAAAWSRLALTC
jgi:hypothetical protein